MMLRSAAILFSYVALADGDCGTNLRDAATKVNETHAECARDMDALSDTMTVERGLVETAHAEWQKRLAAEAAAQKAVDDAQKALDDHNYNEAQTGYNTALQHLIDTMQLCNSAAARREYRDDDVPHHHRAAACRKADWH